MGFTFIRSPKDGDVLWCERELGNREDPFGVGAPKNNAMALLDTCHVLFRVSARYFSGTIDV